MAGNDLALMKSQEAAEDDVILSVEDLKRRTEGYDHVIYIGITCGLSAPYVGSQLDWILNTPDAVRSLNQTQSLNEHGAKSSHLLLSHS